jgi:hypothetical protein
LKVSYVGKGVEESSVKSGRLDNAKSLGSPLRSRSFRVATTEAEMKLAGKQLF